MRYPGKGEGKNPARDNGRTYEQGGSYDSHRNRWRREEVM